MRGAALILACFVAGCRPAAPAEAPAPAVAAPGEPALPAVAAEIDLFGEWQVAALDTPLLSADDGRMGDPTRIALLFGAGRIEAFSQCIPYQFRYRRGGERIEVGNVAWNGPVCARRLLPYEEVFDDVMAGASRIESVQGRVRLSGARGSVTLRRSEGGRIANPFGNSPAPGSQLLWGHFRLVEVEGIRPAAGSPIDFAVGQFAIEARSGCHPFRWRLLVEQPRLTLQREPWPEPACEEGLSEAEQAIERVMPQVRRVEWVAPWRVRLGGPAGAVVLERVGVGS